MNANGIVTFEQARFSVITSSCIRMEYSENKEFIDAPSWFAVNRDTFEQDYNIEINESKLIITTKELTLYYSNDNQPFSVANLQIVFNNSSNKTVWHFGQKNQLNLGGTLQTLDGISNAVKLPEGLLSRDGWYYLDDSDSHLFVNNWVELRPKKSGSDGYFFGYGSNYQTALKSLTTISGKAPLPRKYILGAWYSRWYSYTSEDYMKIVKEFDDHDFPLDILVMDMDWHKKEDAKTGFGWANMLGWTGWSWNTDLIKEPKSFLDWCHEQKLHVTLNVHPHDGIRTHEDCYEAFMIAMGEDPKSEKDIPFQAGNKNYMDTYFNTAHKPLEDQGVDFWWVDWQQDSIMPYADGIEKMQHLPLLNHCYYQHTNSRDKRGLAFSRWAGWGDQRYPIHFSGDALSNWEMLAFEIFFTATAGNVGCFFWSHDIGGFHGKRNPELYARWVQFGITTAALRLHSTGDELDRRPWKWGATMEKSMRKSFKLRSQLIPYIYSAIRQCHEQSLPLNRPMYLNYPELNHAYNLPYQYFFGDGFLAAPVITSGQGDTFMTNTRVWLPEGTWVNWFTGEYHEGPCTINVQSDIHSFPLFVRASFPVILQPESNRMTSQVLDTAIIKCFHSNSSQTTTLYEDDGISNDYQQGKFATTQITYTGHEKSAKLLIEPTAGKYKNQPQTRTYKIELTCPKVSQITHNNQNCKFKQTANNTVIELEQQDIRNSCEIDIKFNN